MTDFAYVNDTTNEAVPYRTPDALCRDVGGDPTKRRPKRVPVLDSPSEPHPILNILMGEALTRIMLTADGATMNYTPTEYVRGRADRSTAKGRALADSSGVKRVAAGRSDAPVSALVEDVDELRWRFDRCSTNRRRLLVVREAQRRGNRLLWAPDRSRVKGTAEWRAAIVADPRSCREIADAYGIHYSTVSRMKKQAGEPTLSAKEQKRADAKSKRERVERLEAGLREKASAHRESLLEMVVVLD